MIRFIYVALCACFPLMSFALELDGAWKQGGYISGKAAPGSAVTVNGKSAFVAQDGSFLFGLGRHFPVQATVMVQHQGDRQTQDIIVEPRTYKVQHIQGVASNTVNPNTEELTRIRAQSASILAAREFKTQLFQPVEMTWPVHARLSSVYGSSRTFNGEERSWHKGVDLAAPSGTPIQSPAAGIVRFAARTFFSGNLVIVDHGYGLFGHYAHMKDMAVKEGDVVAHGDVLGHVGATGRVTGPHLHWGLYWQNVALDPHLWVQSE